MAAFNKFNPFVQNLTAKVFNLASDQIKIALCSSSNPPSAANGQLAQLTQINYTNLSSRNVTTISAVQTGGVLKLILTDLVLSLVSTGGASVGPFQYVVLYDDTATNDELIGWYDYGGNITLNSTDTFTIDFDNTNGVLQLA